MKKRSRGVVLAYIYTAANMVVGLFMSVFILRTLGKTEYGLYQTMTSFATYLSLFQFGTGTIMTRNIALCTQEKDSSLSVRKNFSTVWSITQILSAVILTVAVVFYLFIDRIYSESLTPAQISTGKLLFVLVVFKMIFAFWTQTLNGAMLGFERYSISTVVSLVFLALRTLTVVVLLTVRPDALTLVITDTVLEIFVLLFTVIYCKRNFDVSFSFRYFDAGIFKSIMPLALALFLQVIVNQANGNVDKFFIGVLMSPESVAVYSVGMYIYTVFSSLTTIPISMYMPQVAHNIKSGISSEELTQTLIQPCRLITLIGGSVLFGFISFGKVFVKLFYGNDYTEAWLIAVIIMVPMFINMCNGVIVNVLDVLSKRYVRSLCLLGTTAANIALTIWWIKVWGIVGAAVATAICTLIGQVLIMNIYYSRVLKIKIIYLFRKSFSGLLIWLIAAAAVSAPLTYVIKNLWLSFFVSAAVFLAVGSAGILLFGLNKAEKAACSRALLKIRHMIRK